jgi:hypothetical protein
MHNITNLFFLECGQQAALRFSSTEAPLFELYYAQ